MGRGRGLGEAAAGGRVEGAGVRCGSRVPAGCSADVVGSFAFLVHVEAVKVLCHDLHESKPVRAYTYGRRVLLRMSSLPLFWHGRAVAGLEGGGQVTRRGGGRKL